MSKSKAIDLSGFSDDKILSLYKSSMRGVRRQGYDDSNDTTVDYTPSAEDAINASKIVASDYDFGDWKDVKDQVKHGYSEEDLIFKMRGAVGKEFLNRQENRLSGMESDISGNSDLIAGLQAQYDEQGNLVTAAAPAGLSDKASSAQAAVDAYDNGLSSAGSFFNTAKDQVKTSMKNTGVSTRGPGSGINGNGFGAYGGGKQFTDDRPSSGPTNLVDKYGPKAYLKDYKLDLADGLTPNNRSSAVQRDKDTQQVHQMVQQGTAPTPSDFTLQPGKFS